MKPEERREKMATLVNEATRISVDELAALLDTSRETVRRDLTLLSEQGLLRKVHGGAVSAQTALESPMDDRRSTARAEKLAIGRAASQLFNQGDSLLVDTGSTTACFAEALKSAGNFTVITNSVMVAHELWSGPGNSEVYLLGGRYHGDGHEILGPMVIEQIGRLHADHAVLTIGAIDPSGIFMDFNADEAFVARAMIASARQVTVLADGSKLGRHALFEVCRADKVGRLVTDRAPTGAVGTALHAANVEIVVAEPAFPTRR